MRSTPQGLAPSNCQELTRIGRLVKGVLIWPRVLDCQLTFALGGAGSGEEDKQESFS